MNVTEWRNALMEATFPSTLALQEGQRVRQIASHDVRNVLGWLSTFADRGSGENAHPGIENLSKLTGMSDRQVRRCLKAALSTGWAVVSEQPNGRAGHATVYALCIPSAPNHVPTSGATDRATEPAAQEVEPEAHSQDHRPPQRGRSHIHFHLSDPTCHSGRRPGEQVES